MVDGEGEEVVEEEAEAVQQKDSRDCPTTEVRTDQEQMVVAEAAEEDEGEVEVEGAVTEMEQVVRHKERQQRILQTRPQHSLHPSPAEKASLVLA